MSWNWELVFDHDYITEGPVWDGRHLFYSEIGASRTWRYDPDSGERVVWREDTGRANGMLRAPGGGLLACEGGGRRVVRYVAGEQTEVIADHCASRQFNEPNDLAQSASGSIWFSDPNYGERPMQLDHESVYRVDPGAEAVRATFDTNRPNGVLLTADESELYVAESPHRQDQRRQLRAYPIAADGSLGERRVLHDFGDGRGVDGMTRTTEGLIVATAGHHERGPGPMIYVFEASGRVLSTHPTPADRPTNCTFAEAGRRVLYVTFGGGELYRATNTGLIGDL
jgi:gluconolactonase